MNIRNSLSFLLVLFLVLPSKAQDFREFIQHCWDNNKQLKARVFELSQAETSLAEARAMYGPTIAFGTQYTLAYGGRSIDFPIGDLLNPVHTQLNELTGSEKFHTLENEEIYFLPHNFYDARFRIQQPVFYPELAVNRSLNARQLDLKSLEIKAFKRLLVKEFMESYFQWKQAGQAVGIYLQADTLLQEADRSTRSMIRHGVALPSSLSRIEAETATVQAQLIETRAREENAWNYLLFLLGSGSFTREQLDIVLPDLPDPVVFQSGIREEIQQLEVGIEMQGLAVEKENLFHKPRVAAQLDLGSQDFNFGLEPYALLGINLEWNIFDNRRHQLRKEQALAGLKARQEEQQHVSDQLTMQTAIALRNLEAAIEQASTYQPRIRAAEKTYHDILKKYQSGSAGYLELLDARTQVTQSEMAYLVSRYQAWSRWAEYLYTTAAYPIE